MDPVTLSFLALGLQSATAIRKYNRDKEKDLRRAQVWQSCRLPWRSTKSDGFQHESGSTSPPFFRDHRQINCSTSGGGQVFNLPDGTVL